MISINHSVVCKTQVWFIENNNTKHIFYNMKNFINTFDKHETKASLVVTIRDMLWQELPESYPDESINYYRDAVFNYISQRYGGMA